MILATCSSIQLIKALYQAIIHTHTKTDDLPSFLFQLIRNAVTLGFYNVPLCTDRSVQSKQLAEYI